MSAKPDNPNAFPLPASGSDACHGFECGMTLRDYFAAAALQGMCAYGAADSKHLASHAYELADDMLKARANN